LVVAAAFAFVLTLAAPASEVLVGVLTQPTTKRARHATDSEVIVREILSMSSNNSCVFD
jgi:hypothetical protein